VEDEQIEAERGPRSHFRAGSLQRVRLLVLALVAVGLAVVGCVLVIQGWPSSHDSSSLSAESATEPSALFDTRWRFVGEDGRTDLAADPDSPIVLEFRGSSTIVWNGCGQPQGRVEIGSGTLRTSAVVATALPCGDAPAPGYYSPSKVSVDLAKSLGGTESVANWLVNTEGHLSISSERSGLTLLFERVAAQK
jgi:hypothetical protein